MFLWKTLKHCQEAEDIEYQINNFLTLYLLFKDALKKCNNHFITILLVLWLPDNADGILQARQKTDQNLKSLTLKFLRVMFYACY